MNKALTVSGTNSTSIGATEVLALALTLVLADKVVSVGGLCNEETQEVRSCKQGSVRKDPAPVRGWQEMMLMRERVRGLYERMLMRERMNERVRCCTRECVSVNAWEGA